ncbi:hypothetical protein BN14_06764 [Rhizoctonia solani AG-1 IB]|uniref:Uncharacterized protein n=1 Tax=Thanatephorus cucumeris (strain AG1-IB / isolate 7/3/14) TaxID=1108050 RepID=M5BZM6_THACB|nr:hypothetical protein BN14_06764 [Rhizoctonia solani AG-1 IB]
MDLKHKHASQGLTRLRLKHQFGSSHKDSTLLSASPEMQANQNDKAAEEIANVNMMEEDVALNFRSVAAQLCQDVINNKDPLDNKDGLQPESGVATHCLLEASLPKRVRLFFGTQIPVELKDLFEYKRGDEKDGLGFFKQAGVINLEKELEIYSLATRKFKEGMAAETVAD